MRSVRFAEDSLGVTAHTRQPPPRAFTEITGPLTAREVGFTIDFATGAYIDASLPDGSFLLAGPAFKEGYDDDFDEAEESRHGWHVGWIAPGLSTVETLYDSEPGGPDQQHGTDVAPMVASINEHLDRRGVPSEQEVQDRLNRAESLLRQAGFVQVEHYHRLPAATIEPAERRAAVTQAVGYLRAEGLAVDGPADLIDHSADDALPAPWLARPGPSIGATGHPVDEVGTRRVSAARAASPAAVRTPTGHSAEAPSAPTATPARPTAPRR